MTTELASVCTLDCPDTCSLTVTVESGRITKVRGSDALPLTERRHLQQSGAPLGRLRTWAGAIDDTPEACGPARPEPLRADLWEQALDIIYRAGERGHRHARARSGDAAELRRPARHARRRQHVFAVLPQARREPALSPVHVRQRCAARPGPALTAWSRASAPRRPRTPSSTIVWGNNATVANLHLVRKIRMSLRKGGKLVVIDTLRTKIAEQADLHIAPRPSTDVLLGFALAVELKRIGAHDRAFIDQHVLGYDAFMARADDGRWRRLPPNAASKPRISARSRAGWPMRTRSSSRPATGLSVAAMAAAVSGRRLRCRR